MQDLSISVMFVPHRLGCIYVRRGVPSVTQNVFILLGLILLPEFSIFEYETIDLEVFPQKKRVIYIGQCSVATRMLRVHTMGSPGFLLCTCEFHYLRCAEIQQNLVILSNPFFAS